MDFVLERGNIINCDTDAVVLPANIYLKEGTGTSHAIFSAAGRKELTKACSDIGRCELGTAVPTSGYKLRAEFIIHAVVPKWIDGAHNEYELLSSAYISSLAVADTMKCESISFPMLSAGNNGFDRGVAFQVARESINSFEGENLREVKLIVYDEEMAVFVRTQGYDVVDHIKISKLKRNSKNKEIKDKALNAGIEFIKEHKGEIIKYGIEIAALVILKKTPKEILIEFAEKSVKN